MTARGALLSILIVGAMATTCHAGSTMYVALNGGHVYPFATWASAATNIQVAVNAALDGDILIVSNGVYSGFGANLNGSNVVAINKLLTMTSLNGAGATIIDGGGKYRCLYVREGVLVRGFTFRNGSAGNGAGVYCYYGGNIEDCVADGNAATLGGGAYFNSGGLLTNCVLRRNAATLGGGGAFFNYANGLLVNSYVASNSAQYGGGVACEYGGAVLGCTIVSNTASDTGGGVSCNEYGTVTRCTIVNNAALGLVNNWGGGGVRLHQGGTVISSLIVSNVARLTGGGVFAFDGGHVYNCTVAANVATNIGGIYFQDLGGVYDLEVLNTISYYNQNGNNNGGLYLYTCTLPGLMGAGNITNDPLFVNVASNNFHLQMNSPCVDTGTNMVWMASQRDLDGNPRVMYGQVDMGAYETYRWMTLEVQSDAPSNNVTIACAPAATNGVTSAATPFTLVYDALTEVVLTAPASATNRYFDRWEIDGVSFGPALAVTVQMAAAHVATAYYVGAGDSAQVLLSTDSNNVPRNSAVDLGVTSGSYTIARAFVISNSGTASLTLTGAPPVRVQGAWSNFFAISAQPASVYIPPKKTQQFTVLFQPPTTSNGSVAATISFAHIVAAQNPFAFIVTGAWRNFTPQPGSPVMATAGSYNDRVHVWWPASLGATFYELFRSTTNNMATGVLIANGEQLTNYTDTAVVPGQLYYYWVRTRNEYGQSVYGGPASGYARLEPGAGVNASDGAATDRIAVQWQALVGATSYKLYRNTSADTATMALIATLSTTVYTDTSLMPGRTYYYWVRGAASAGDGALSPYDSGYAAMLPPASLAASENVTGGVMLWWPPAAGAASYVVYRGTTPLSNAAAQLATVTDPSYWDSTVTPGAPYYYWVQAVAQACVSPLGTAAVGYAALATPTAVIASDGIYTNKVAVQWVGVPGALTYTVLRGVQSGSASPTAIGTTAATQFDDFGAMPGTVYYYRVQANAVATSGGQSLENSGYALFAVKANSWWLWHSKTKVRTKAFQLDPALGPFLAAGWRVGLGTLSNGSFVVTHGPHALLPGNAPETLWITRNSGRQPFFIQYNTKNNRLIYNYVGALPSPVIVFIVPQSIVPGVSGLLTLSPYEPRMSVGFYLTPAPGKTRGGWQRMNALMLDVTSARELEQAQKLAR
jgi:fibronectin type 3 domain-containing protein